MGRRADRKATDVVDWVNNKQAFILANCPASQNFECGTFKPEHKCVDDENETKGRQRREFRGGMLRLLQGRGGSRHLLPIQRTKQEMPLLVEHGADSRTFQCEQREQACLQSLSTMCLEESWCRVCLHR